MLARVPAEYPKIRALLYFDKYDSSMDWPLETSSSALSAFAEGVQSSAYVGNTLSSLSATKNARPSRRRNDPTLSNISIRSSTTPVVIAS